MYEKKLEKNRLERLLRKKGWYEKIERNHLGTRGLKT